MVCPLSDLEPGIPVKVKYIKQSPFKMQLLEMGISINSEIEVIKTAPFNDPLECKIEGVYCIGLRRSEASLIYVENKEEK